MWTAATRAQHRREARGYATDVSDREWQVIAPLLPQRAAAGRAPKWPVRRIVDAIFYLLRGGVPWHMLPHDFPPKSTVNAGFTAWRDNGVLERVNAALVAQDRRRKGRHPEPTAAIVDSQSVSTTESGGPRGYDPAKKVKGRKRHPVVDTDGRVLIASQHSANLQDRQGARRLLAAVEAKYPSLRRIFADRGYAYHEVYNATSIPIEIVRKPDRQAGFVVQPRRWVVERFLAWINRNRRLARDFETTLQSANAWLYLASIQLLTRRIAKDS